MKRFYGHGVEEGMIIFYDSLSEKDKRRYAAIEVQKLPYLRVPSFSLLGQPNCSSSSHEAAVSFKINSVE